ncbi:unnamed protein product [Lactuca saligna]|uniref:Uncharacterized protein n=1 Tax=Lactuca saligna TaxID=75948 RepID=A0AA36E725_LACSI|nr:unnamed protein product [Lactuca saligna]
MVSVRFRFWSGFPVLNLISTEDRHEVPLQLVGDPYFPESLPMAPTDLSEEEDPSKDEEEDDPEEVEESEDKIILHDPQEEMDDDGLVEDEESLTGEESTPHTPASSPYRPYYQPYFHHGRSSLLMRTPRMLHHVYNSGMMTHDNILDDKVQSLDEHSRATCTTYRVLEKRVGRHEHDGKDEIVAI